MHTVVNKLAVAAVAAVALAAALVDAGAAAASPQRPATESAVTDVTSAFTPATAATRLLDTRQTGGPLTANSSRALTVVRSGSPVPANATAVVVDLTVVTPSAAGYLRVSPGGTPALPAPSVVDFATQQTVANLATVQLAGNGINLYYVGSGRIHVLVDVTGWYTPTASAEGAFTPTPITRVADTRPAAIAAGGSRVLTLRGSTVSSTAGAVLANVTVLTPSASGHLTVYPSDEPLPNTLTLAFTSGRVVAGLATLQLSAAGTVTVYNSSAAAVNVLVDVEGWYLGTTARQSSLFTVSSARTFDTRNGTNTTRAKIAAGATRRFAVAGLGTVPLAPADAGSVVLTITATTTAAAGSVTVFGGGTAPSYPSLYFAKGVTASNLVVVPVASDGTIGIVNRAAGTIDVIADVAGYVRNADATGSVSHYLRSLTASQSTAAISTRTSGLGSADAQAAVAHAARVVLLQFGAQSNKAGGDGSGTGSQDGVRLTATNMRITYPQVVAAVNGYVDGDVAGRGSNDAPLTVVVGTSTAGFAGATYDPRDKATDWWSEVVAPAVQHAAGTGVTVVGGTDIEANFDGNFSDVQAWVTTYLQSAPTSTFLVNNGAASGCPTTIGSTSECVAVPIEDTDPVQTQTFTRAQVYAVSGGLSPGRIKVLPQIYSSGQAGQWENVDLTGIAAGKPALVFAGVLSSSDACGPSASECSSVDPDTALLRMNAALDARSSTASTALPAVTDLTVS